MARTGRPPKIYPPELVELVRRLYCDEEKAQHEIGGVLGVTKGTVRRIMRRHGIEARHVPPQGWPGDTNPRWKGPNAGYKALHQRVEAARGRPAWCGRCHSSDPAIRYEWANLTGRYDDVNDYERMCVPCHRRYDRPRQHPNPKKPGQLRKRVVCVTCGREGVHGGRGRCGTCYTRLRRQGFFAREDGNHGGTAGQAAA